MTTLPRKTMPTHCTEPRESGFTLVELLVVMVIAMVMLLGVVTLVRQLQHQFRAQTVVSRLNDDARFAFEVIGDAIQGAGSTDPENPQPMDAPVDVNSAQLTVRYFSPYGCYGGAGSGVHTVTFGLSYGQLQRDCDGDNQPLIGAPVDNRDFDYATTVDTLSFSYAIDENADQSVDCWYPDDPSDQYPACTTDPPDAADVIGVRVSLVLSAKNPVPSQPNQQQIQDPDIVRRTYVMTFPIDSKLGFFVANQ